MGGGSPVLTINFVQVIAASFLMSLLFNINNFLCLELVILRTHYHHLSKSQHIPLQSPIVKTVKNQTSQAFLVPMISYAGLVLVVTVAAIQSLNKRRFPHEIFPYLLSNRG